MNKDRAKEIETIGALLTSFKRKLNDIESCEREDLDRLTQKDLIGFKGDKIIEEIEVLSSCQDKLEEIEFDLMSIITEYL